MARKTVLVSDLSGEEIPDAKGATVTINFRDARKGVVVLDVTDSEADQDGREGSATGSARQATEVRFGSFKWVEPIEGVGISVVG